MRSKFIRRKYIGLLTAFIFLVTAMVYLIAQDRQQSDLSVLFSVVVHSESGDEVIKCWQDEDEKIYIFLPSYAGLSQIEIRLNTASPLYVGGLQLYDGMTCEEFEMNVPYVFTYKVMGISRETDLIFVQSAGVPTVFIDTDTGSMEYIHSKKGNEESGYIRIYEINGLYDYIGGIDSIKGRGNNTWDEFEKKPYSIVLSVEADLLDMGSARRWILLANADDHSNLRNKIVYDFAYLIGMPYVPESRWVDLYLNGEYVGLYLLCERNEVHPERVDISSEHGYLVSLEREDRLIAQGYQYISTDASQSLRIHYPDEISSEKMEESAVRWQHIENAILSPDGIDPVSGMHWIQMIDIDSWVYKYLIEEVFCSGDACYISQYFYWEESDVVFAGPVWDFDHSLGSEAAWQLMDPNTMYANRLHVKDGYDSPWFYNLYRNEVFYNRVVDVYQSVFLPAIEEMFENRIFIYADQISAASDMNRIRWFSDDEKNVTGYAEYISSFMRQRTAFLFGVWCENKEYCFVKADHGFGGFYGYFAVSPGECLTTLPVFEDTETSVFQGWYYADSGKPFDSSTPINEDIQVIARWTESTSHWIDRIGKLIPFALFMVLLLMVSLFSINQKNEKKS